MKPPETVTLINLDGTLVFPSDTRHEDYMLGSFFMANNSEHGWYAIEFSAGFSRQVVGLDDNAKILEERENVIFLNDQLTFIRNGMWETLAIYQATLGRYWEVPYVKVHELKIDAEYYMAVQAGNKKVELRYNDRNYEVGDIIRLRNPDADNALDLLITHVLQYEPALKDGWVAISFDVITPLDHRYSFMKDQLNVRKEQPPNDPTRD